MKDLGIPTKNSCEKVLEDDVRKFFEKNSQKMIDKIILDYKSGYPSSVLSFGGLGGKEVFLRRLSSLILVNFREVDKSWDFSTEVLVGEGFIRITF